MKLIITEEQLRLIIENENKVDMNLMKFNSFVDLNPSDWDKMFLHMNNKKGGKYDGYYIEGDLDFSERESEVTTLDYLVKVGGNLYLTYTKIKSLPRLVEVGGYLDLEKTQIKSLPMLSSVGGYLGLVRTPLSKKTSEEELRKQIKVGGKIYLNLWN